MALFPHIDLEEKVQINDKTRFDLSKSYVTKGGSPLTIMTVTPGIGATAISVFDTTVANRFTDFQFDVQSFDIDSTNNKLDFDEGAGELTATLTGASYSQAALLTEIETQLNAAGTGTYTVTADSKNKITISSDVNFKLLPVSGSNWLYSILPHIGFKLDTNTGITQTGSILEYGIKKITASIGDGTLTATLDRYIKVFTEYSDNLFSSDAELQQYEGDVLKWVRGGRATFKNIIRKSQDLIMDWIDAQGFVDIYGKKFVKWDLIDVSEVREWSTMMSLRLIFEGLSNATDDVFSVKAKNYEAKENRAKQRFLRLDINKDGVIDEDESVRIRFGNLFMR